MSVRARLGLPYATARRFAPPEPVVLTDDAATGGTFGPSAPQPLGSALGGIVSGMNVTHTDEQTCLTLNVWSPSAPGPHPVLVWIIGGNNNRYFVVPLLLWGAAGLVALDNVFRRSRWWMVAIGIAAVVVIWWPAFGASWFRTTPAPPWQEEVARVAASCKADPGKSERPIFSPFWPPNWGDGLAEPSHPNLPCVIGYTWSP